jgi:hypothetical protein
MFSDHELRDVIDNRKRAIASEIDSLSPNYILNANVEDLSTYFEQKYRYQAPVLRTNEVCFEQDEVEVDVSQDFNRGIDDPSQPFYVKGTSITFIVPFDGDSELFRYRPSAFTSSLPYGEVGENELRLEYRSADHEGQRMKSAFDQNIREIQQYLGFVSENITQFNDSLTRDVSERINERREKLLKDQNLAASLGVPMKKREGVPQTYSVPVARKKLAIQLPTASTQPFKPEPALEMQAYDQILGMVSSMALVLERSPQTFAGMKEEDLRTHFLVALNAHYEGQATGETFNYEGKTDILIRVNGRNIFIAECKFWRGPEGLVETIDQLLGYTSWRDTKTAIILFNRNKNLSGVLEKIPDAISSHSNFKLRLDYQSETGFRFVFRQKNDLSRDITLSVLVFDVPSEAAKVTAPRLR